MTGLKGSLARHLSIFIVLLTIWEGAARVGLADPLVLPAPSLILAAFFRLYVEQGNIYYHLGITLAEVFVGFALGAAFGIVLAIGIGMNALARRLIKPYIIVLEATPRIAIGPLILAALGFGWSSKMVIVMLVSFFPPFVNTLSGMLNVDEDAHQLFKSLRASKLQVFRKLMLPDAMPVIMAGLRLAMTSALSGALVAEFISAGAGVGVLLKRYTGALNMPSAFACMFTLTLVGFAVFRLMEWADRRLIFWRHSGPMQAVAARRRRRFVGAVGGDSARPAEVPA